MAFLCPMIPERRPTQTVYTLKRARKRQLQTLRPLLVSGSEETKSADQEDDDDNDSGISSHGTAGSGASPDLSKVELATKLALASPRNPARLKVRVMWNFEPVEESELRVAKGELVQVLYRDNDWVLAVNSCGKRGFIPFSYSSLPLRKAEFNANCSLLFGSMGKSSQRTKNQILCSGFSDDVRTITRSSSETQVHATKLNSLPGYRELQRRSQSDEGLLGNTSSSSEDDSVILRKPTAFSETVTYGQQSSSELTIDCEEQSILLRKASEDTEDTAESVTLPVRKRSDFTEVTYSNRTALERHEVVTTIFQKCPYFKAIVLYDFVALDENDVSVCKGDIVSVLNKEDEAWWWVLTAGGVEGFVPSSYLSKHLITYSERTLCSVESASSTSESSSTQAVRFQDPLCTFHRYEREDWETDSQDSLGDEGHRDAEVETYLDSKYSTWC